MRTVFFGSSSLAVPSLEALTSTLHRPLLVVTQPDRPAGRGMTVAPPPVKLAAIEHNLSVFQPENAHSEDSIARLKEVRPELFLVMAYARIFRRSLLELPRYGCVNVHASLLPRYRGPAPVPWAILNGDKETGVSVIRMVPEVDAGPILGQRSVEITPRETAGELAERLGKVAATLLVEVVTNIERGTASARPQDESMASYAAALRKSEGEVMWTHSAWYICSHVRAMTPWPTAFTFFMRKKGPLRVALLAADVVEPPYNGNVEPGTVLDVGGEQIVVAAGEEAVRIERIKPSGAREMTAAEFVRGYRVKKGDRFGSIQQSLRFHK